MSAKLSGLIWEAGPKERMLRFVLLAIADNANDDGYAYPGVESLADKCLFTQRYVISSIQKLEESGWLRVDRKARNGGNEYYIDVDKLETLGEEFRKIKKARRGKKQTTPVDCLPETSTHEQSSCLSSLGEIDDVFDVKSTAEQGEIYSIPPTPPYKENRQETSKEPFAQSESALVSVPTKTKTKTVPRIDLEEIYQAYPRHVGKVAAFKAIEKVRKQRTQEEILGTVKRYAEKILKLGTEEQFIPHPATWFNRGSYDDDDLKPTPKFTYVEVTPEEWWGKDYPGSNA